MEEKKNLVDGMLTAFQIFHEKMPFTPTATTDSFLPPFTPRQGEWQVGGGGREGEQIERFSKLFKLELYYVTVFRIKHIYQITDF